MRLFAVIFLVSYCSFSLAFAPARRIDVAPWARTVAFDDGETDLLTTSPTSSSSSSTPRAKSQAPSSTHSSTRSTDSHITIKTSSTRIYTVTKSSSNNDPFDFATITESSINRDPFNFSTITEAHSSSASSTSADTTSIERIESSLSAQPTSASRNATDRPQITPPPPPTTSFQLPANQTGSATTSSTSPVTETSPAPPPVHCAPGTSCSVVLGVGLSVGSVAFIMVVLVVSGRYRKFLAASQQSYRDHRRRRHSADEPYGPSKEHEDLNMTSFNQTQTTSPLPEYCHKDEPFLPEDVQQVVRNVDSMRQQRLKMPADAYGTISRKPLPKSTNF